MIRPLMLLLGLLITLNVWADGAPVRPPNPLDTIPDAMPNDIPYGAPLSLDQANAVIAAARKAAESHHWKLNIAAVDSGGNLVAFARMDSAQLASIAISEHKAHAAVTFRRETKSFENGIQVNGYAYITTLDGVIASRGGFPLIVDGKIVGGLGCSGGTGSQDEAACAAGVAAFGK
jgi:uncharacterized protein GlcG (DUF336 family)